METVRSLSRRRDAGAFAATLPQRCCNSASTFGIPFPTWRRSKCDFYGRAAPRMNMHRLIIFSAGPGLQAVSLYGAGRNCKWSRDGKTLEIQGPVPLGLFGVTSSLHTLRGAKSPLRSGWLNAGVNCLASLRCRKYERTPVAEPGEINPCAEYRPDRVFGNTECRLTALKITSRARGSYPA